jgi:hypothetical protein
MSTYASAHLKLFKECERLQRQAGDVTLHLSGIERDERLDYLLNQVMDSAHAILDYAHEFKQQALKDAQQ